MSDSLYIAATGMHAQQLQIDVIANNLANVNTPGFKKSRVEFEDLMYRAINKTQALDGSETGNELVGVGTAVNNASKVFTMGDIKKTERLLDLAIQGEGFFEVLLEDGGYAYTRSGSLHVDSDGNLVNSNGYLLNPVIQVPNDATELLFKSDGTVHALVEGDANPVEIGQLELANFVNSSGLKPLGNNVYESTQESGEAYYNKPGENGLGGIAQGFIESSNVKLAEELTNLIIAQRAFEINSKVIQASDELLSIVNNLRR